MKTLEKILEKVLQPITSEKVEKKGQFIYKLGKLFVFIGLCGFAILLFLSFCALILGGSEYVICLFSFILDGFEFVAPLLVLGYLAIALGFIGIPLYFYGLYIYTLGRIANNTEL